MSCKGLCETTFSNIAVRQATYSRGYKRCTTCAIYIKWDDSRCPCCHRYLRYKPKSKQRSLELEIRAGMNVLEMEVKR